VLFRTLYTGSPSASHYLWERVRSLKSLIIHHHLF